MLKNSFPTIVASDESAIFKHVRNLYKKKFTNAKFLLVNVWVNNINHKIIFLINQRETTFITATTELLQKLKLAFMSNYKEK